MNPLCRTFVTAAVLLATAASLLGANLAFPLEFRQSETLYNLQSQRGVPISTNLGVPAGSDGRMPRTNDSFLSNLRPTTNQFQGCTVFGGVTAPTNRLAVSNSSLLHGASSFCGAVARAMQLPLGTSNNAADGPVALILRRGQIGAPYLSRQVSFPFGSIVEAPPTDENGVMLTNPATPYWFAEPYSANQHSNSGYYWSPHAGKVYASQAGPVAITWKKMAYVAGPPADYTNAVTGATNYYQNGGNYYRLYSVNYLVSGSAVKTPRKLYWTEKGFRNLGKPVAVPEGRVSAISIAYNSDCPRTVTNQYSGPGDTNPTDGSTNQVLQELRTLWYDADQHSILAYNREGRVLLELLGDARPDGQTRIPLGFEIVDVAKDPTPLDVTSELGESIEPPSDTREELTPEPIVQTGTETFAYRQIVSGSGQLNLYATRATANLNDYLVHWMETGEAGLKWPKHLGRYRLVWPADVTRYSHYVRPLVATEAEARTTAVPLPTANAPTLEYQDVFADEGIVRGKLTETFAYYSFLDAAHPLHRALLRFSSGDEVAFERVFSWLDANLKATNFANTIATNFPGASDYPAAYANYLVASHNYPAALSNYTYYATQSTAYDRYAQYTAYLTNRSRGVNGTWKLYVSDDARGGAGSLGGWRLLVETTNSDTGLLSTREFTNGLPITLYDNANASPYPSSITVSGVTDAVTAVRVRLGGLTHPVPEDVDAFLVGPRGNVCTLMSDALRKAWTMHPSTNPWSAVASSTDGTKLVAAARAGRIHTSTDGGTSWTPRGPAGPWVSVASSADGKKLVAAAYGGRIFTSTDSGQNWSGRDQTRNWAGVACSTNGSKLVAVDYGAGPPAGGGDIYTSTNGGTNWTQHSQGRLWFAVASSADGTKLVALESAVYDESSGWLPGSIYTSGDAGSSWTPCSVSASGFWCCVAASADGSKLVAATDGGQIHTSTNFGLSWVSRNSGRRWGSAACSSDGTQMAVAGSGYIVTSTDFGTSWSDESAPSAEWSGLALSADGAKLAATISNGPIYTTVNTALTVVNLVLDDAALGLVPLTGPLEAGTCRPTDYDPPDSLPPNATGPSTASLAALLLPAPVPATAPPQPFVTNAPVVVPKPITPIEPRLWPDDLAAPRVVRQVVNVGERLSAPDHELGATNNYLAGYINQGAGTLFNVRAYVDPFANGGFTAANQGAIIPVNAIPGRNTLEVWWFRTNAPSAGAHAADARKGFLPIYWPSVLGHYTLEWPASPLEIVLASKLGSGTLGPFEALGTIYYQNNATLPGYNPNEEHAIMSSGAAYATRDDLNLSGSSQPFVLVDHTAPDGRPAMVIFKVLREKPEAGWVFDYIVPAGQLLQPPMPLPLLGKPVEGSGDNASNYNTEPTSQAGDLPGAWNETRDSTNVYRHYKGFTYRDRHQDFWVYRGPHAGLPALEAGTYLPARGVFVALTNATAVAGQPFSLSVHASREYEYLALSMAGAPGWLDLGPEPGAPLTLTGTPGWGDLGTSAIKLIVSDLYDQSRITNTLTLTVSSNGAVLAQAPLVLPSTNLFTGTTVSFSNRPPFLALSPNPSNSFTMRYYYKTEPSFAWPGVADPPPAGAIVPYLRALTNGTTYVGDGKARTDPALDIVYRPVWPVRDPKDSTKPLPALPYGLTLARPQLGLPGVRDWKTARVLYQQSIAADLTKTQAAVVLHDPTRMKTAAITNFGMEELPASVYAQSFQGKFYFPNLPPHLAKRLYFDPNRGGNGSLVLIGEFKDETVGEDYLLLNVLRGSDLTNAFGLCPPSDTVNYPKWTNAIAALATDLETFCENTKVPGTYVPDPNRTVKIGAQNLAEVSDDNVAVDSYALSATGPGRGYVTLVEAGGTAVTEPGDPVALHIFKVGGSLWPGELKVIPSENPLSELVSFQHTLDLAGRFNEYEYEWKIGAPVDGLPPTPDATMSRYLSLTLAANQPLYTLGGADIRALGDNYLVLRYRPIHPAHPLYSTPAGPPYNLNATNWSDWTQPQLAEGWIKRVVAGINPFNQRVKDLFNNAAVTDASMLTQAGHRWEGDVALNLDTINNYGLIEIYETVLRRGRSISIESGFNYGPANDALLLAAGYLNDLYMMIGNEAWADAANPTIGIGTADRTYGEIATALFAFKGQVATLLEEELTLVRGRDDFLQPGVTYAPCYNRLVWNYTRGIDAGEVIYALNYNIQENPDLTPDGVINAADAAVMFPQGHGDAYGHYLTALKGYYSLLMNTNFDWAPRLEAVSVLGVPVSVDYQDERKFAAAAAALARAGRQALDLTWRRDYQPGHGTGWSHFAATRENTTRSLTTSSGAAIHPVRYWGVDHWASRTGQGGYLNWVVGNSTLPAVDPNPAHEGIQKIDRTTVPELTELASMAADLQAALDNAEGGLTPLGLPEGSVALDLNPNVVVGPDNGTHFDQTYGRAKVALQNAVAAFDDAKDVTRLMRSEQDSLADFQNGVAKQELAYENALIELYGTPYTDDIGPGKTWKQGYAGPDLLHYSYVDRPEQNFPALWNYPGTSNVFRIDIQDFPRDWVTNYSLTSLGVLDQSDPAYSNGVHYVEINLGEDGFGGKPAGWTGRRASPGRLQQAISRVIAAHTALRQALFDQSGSMSDLNRSLGLFKARLADHDTIRGYQQDLLIAEETVADVKALSDIVDKVCDSVKEDIVFTSDFSAEALPGSMVVGMSTGGDLTSAGRSALEMAGYGFKKIYDVRQIVQFTTVTLLETATATAKRWREFLDVAPLEWKEQLRSAVADLGKELEKIQAMLGTINVRLRELDDAQRDYRALVAQGDRMQEERLVFRQRAAAVVQGYRTRDAAFRIFRNEKLERYKTLFDLAARYAFLAANAYDYETGLLDTEAGRSFISRIVSARALGVVRNGEPQYAGSDTGDPGLSSALAEMKADWDVVKTRLGFNNPDAYGTVVSLRTENFRILPTTNSDGTWMDLLQQSRRRDLMEDADVRRHCLQISRGAGLPVPGIILEFSTTITNGYNLFGQQLAAGDHAYSPSSFATKIFGVGAAFEGYRGMDQPAANGGLGGSSPSDPSLWFLDPLALAATPYVYLVPVGLDFMRTPPLGDADAIRSWKVDDVAVPLPFNIGASQLASGGLYLSADSLSEPLFAFRKHQAFRPVPSASCFSSSLYGVGGTLQRTQYTNNRLIGRSVWNSHWKLVIPGHTLLNDPDEGLERFIQTVRDIKLQFVTYSYSGN